MNPSVYIETTVPSYYYETRRSAMVQAWRAATRRWWDRHRQGYELCTSRFVLAELEHAPARKATQALKLLKGMKIPEEAP